MAARWSADMEVADLTGAATKGSAGAYVVRMIRVVATGTWLYDGVAQLDVLVVEADYDFWFSLGEADGELDSGEAPVLNSEGHVYYVRYRPGWRPAMPFWPDSAGFMSIANAKTAAEAKLLSPVTWS